MSMVDEINTILEEFMEAVKTQNLTDSEDVRNARLSGALQGALWCAMVTHPDVKTTVIKTTEYYKNNREVEA